MVGAGALPLAENRQQDRRLLSGHCFVTEKVFDRFPVSTQRKVVNQHWQQDKAVFHKVESSFPPDISCGHRRRICPLFGRGKNDHGIADADRLLTLFHGVIQHVETFLLISQYRYELEHRPIGLVDRELTLAVECAIHVLRVGEEDVGDNHVVFFDVGVTTTDVTDIGDGVTKVSQVWELLRREHFDVLVSELEAVLRHSDVSAVIEHLLTDGPVGIPTAGIGHVGSEPTPSVGITVGIVLSLGPIV